MGVVGGFFLLIVILVFVLHGRLEYGVGDRVFVTYTIQIHRQILER